ncbi:MAG: hypothetical protein Udaeo2_32200 [Candidatus Udaeobacter sp.]|nr:MAG: hypothetical protein Udaeo2_32200 [Candidatus Udaeobacter sp.]
MKTTPVQFEQSWRIAVMGAFLCAREAVPDMLKRQRGAIVLLERLPRCVGAAAR